MRVLVTGGAGFVGSHVADALAGAGHDVVLLDLLAPATHPGGRPRYVDGYELVVADVTDPDAVHAALDGVDAVSHQAAMVGLGVDTLDLPDYARHNVVGTAVLLAAMTRRGVRRLALASSMVVYGEGGYSCAEHGQVRPPPRREEDLAAGRFEPGCPTCGCPLEPVLVTEDAPPDPRNAYAATKLAQEHLAASWARGTGGQVAALRYHNVYGPRMPRDTPYAGVASILRSALQRGQPPRVFEDGRQRRDFVHVRDVAAANAAALDSPVAAGFRAYNIASGQPHTIGDMAGALAGAFGGPDPVVTGEYRLGDVRHVVAAPGLARTELGFAARVGFAEGMAEFAAAPMRQPAQPI